MGPATLARVSFFSVPVMDRVDHAPAPGPWRTNAAACADPALDPTVREVFTTETPTDFDPAAVAVCAGCAVGTNCDTYAAPIRGLIGIWGGHRRGLRPTGT